MDDKEIDEGFLSIDNRLYKLDNPVKTLTSVAGGMVALSAGWYLGAELLEHSKLMADSPGTLEYLFSQNPVTVKTIPSLLLGQLGYFVGNGAYRVIDYITSRIGSNDDGSNEAEQI